jgi:hypothetical protein
VACFRECPGEGQKRLEMAIASDGCDEHTHGFIVSAAISSSTLFRSC